MVTSAGPIITATFSGKNGSGGISVPGLKAGDFLIWCVMGTTEMPMGASELEAMVSVADEIQQLDSADLSSHTFTVLLIRAT